MWYQSFIRGFRNVKGENGKWKKEMAVHFIGRSNVYNIWINVDSDRIAQRYTQSSFAYQEQLQTLDAMGFGNDVNVQRILLIADGDLDIAIALLTT